MCEKVTFLGIELNSKGYNGIPPERRNVLATVRTPRSLAELFCRICQFSYSSNYIPQFSKLVAPLQKIIKENHFRWDKVVNDAFEGIKMAVALDFKNHSVNVLLPLLLMVDSSKVATSYVIYQIVKGEILTIDMDSRIFSEPEMAPPSITIDCILSKKKWTVN